MEYKHKGYVIKRNYFKHYKANKIMNTYLLKFSNPSDKMEFITDAENESEAIRFGKSNPLYYLDSVHSVNEDLEEDCLLWEK